MAFNAQFFQLNPTTNLADDIKSGYETGYAIRDAERKKALQNLFSQNLSNTGEFNNTNFLEQAAKSGLGIEGVKEWLGQKTAKSDTAVKEATNAGILEMLNRKPDVLRDWFEQEKERKAAENGTLRVSEQGSGFSVAPDNVAPVDVDTLRNPSEIVSKEAPTEKPKAESLIPPTILPEDKWGVNDLMYRVPNKTEDGRVVVSPEYKTKDPGNYTEALQTPKEDQSRKYDVVEESLRRERGSNKVGTVDSTIDGFNDENTGWVPTNDNSNQYRMFASTLANELSANGYSSPKDYLTKLGKSTYNQNLYVPNQMAMYKDGKLDMAAYGAEVSKYEQSKIVAQAKADEAIMKARDELTKKAKEYGVTTVDQSKTEISGDVRLRDPSYRPQASALLTNNVLITETAKELSSASGDIQKLSLIAPSVIRTLSTAANPNAQLSEGTLHENAQRLATSITDDPNLAMKIVGSIVLIPKDGGKSLKNLIVSSANMFNPEVFQDRLSKMLHEAQLMTTKGLDTYTYNNKPTPPPDLDGREGVEFKTKDWFNSKPGSVGFESLTGKKYKVAGRDSFNFPNVAIDREGNQYKLIEGPSGITIEEIVKDEPNEPAKKKTEKKSGGKKVETAAERHKRLFGN